MKLRKLYLPSSFLLLLSLLVTILTIPKNVLFVVGQICATDGSDYKYEESISNDGNTRNIQTSWCPNHPYQVINPNNPIVGDETYSVPAKPIYVASGVHDLSDQGGKVGIAFSSAMIYSPYGGRIYGQATDQASSATVAEGDTFDQCGGHGSSNTQSSYHYHTAPPCLLQQLGNQQGSHSPQIGWMADGFPLYGPYGKDGTVMKPCSVTGGTFGTDTCTNDDGGYYNDDGTIDDFVFRYYTIGTVNDGLRCRIIENTTPYPGTDETTFPNTPNGLYGCCPSGVSCSANWLPQCTNSQITPGYLYGSATALYPNGLSFNSDACFVGDDEPTDSPTPAPAPTTDEELSNSPTSASAPTTDDEPTNSPTPASAPSTDEEGSSNFCFSAMATVEIIKSSKKNDVAEEECVTQVVPMKDLRVGDRVKTGNMVTDGGSGHHHYYETVYAFGHFHKSKRVTFLQIHTTTDTTTGVSSSSSSTTTTITSPTPPPLPLEITEDHLIYLHGKKRPVRAGTIRVGDVLISPKNKNRLVVAGENHNNNDDEAVGVVVTNISRVTRDDGMYAPLTPSGRIVVNGIVASAYATTTRNIQIAEWLSFFGGVRPEDAIHLVLSPLRILCHDSNRSSVGGVFSLLSGSSSAMCEDLDPQTGMNKYVAWGINTIYWLENTQSVVLQFIVMVVALMVYTPIWLLEEKMIAVSSSHFLYTNLVVAAVIVAMLLVYYYGALLRTRKANHALYKF